MNFKKTIAAVVIAAACLCFYAQSANQNNSDSNQNVETNVSAGSSKSSELEQKINSAFSANNSAASGNLADAQVKSTSSVGLFFRMILVLAFVIGLIYGILWFIKNKTNVIKTDDDFLRRVAYINLAPGKTVEVVTLIDKAYLIGVTEDNITLLGEIDDKELINAMNLNSDRKQNITKPMNFNDVLNIFTVKKNKSAGVFTESEQQVEAMFDNGNE